MFQNWRLQLLEAETAFKAGRLEEASRLACRGELQQYLPAKKLLAKVAAEMLRRGQTHVARGETSAGWRDLQTAEAMGGAVDTASRLRKELTDKAMREAEQSLAAGNVEACLNTLESLAVRTSPPGDVRMLKQVALKVELSRKFARQGQFQRADEALAAAIVLRPDMACLEEMRAACQAKLAGSRALSEEMYRALETSDWPKAMSLAEQLLELSPECAAAQTARWKAITALGLGRSSPRQNVAASATRIVRAAASPAASAPSAVLEKPAMAARPAGSRFLMWIDGVGGYLVCTGNEVLIGQPAADGLVDIPILGDLSRQHAKIGRQGEGYLLTPLRPTSVNGKLVEGPTSLVDGALIELGEGVVLRFRRPHPLSASARLEFVSRHRLQPKADAVLLMADSLIVGPASNCHVPCHNWTRQLVLHKQPQGLGCRMTGIFQVDGREVKQQSPLSWESQVVGEDFSLSLEPLA